jgi:UPF0716 protein FxsA
VALLFLLFPALEIYLYVLLGGSIGAGYTLAVIGAAALAGALILRFQGFSLLMKARRALIEGRQPAPIVIDGVAVLVAGLLLLLPGMISDLLGLLLLVPPVRRWLIGRLANAISRQLRRRAGIVEEVGEVIDVTFREEPPDPPGSLPGDRGNPSRDS